MEMKTLGETGLHVSSFCLGTANFGGKGEFKKAGEISRKEADFIVGRAMDSGINFFNTAEIYSDGLSESILGKARGKRRNEAVVISKVHPNTQTDIFEKGYSRKRIIESCESALKRLGTDYLDVYQLHMFDPITPLEVTIGALNELVQDGKVRYTGCSNFTGFQLMKALSLSKENGWARFTTCEAMYSLAARWLELEVIPACVDQNVALLSFSPLHGGLLSGKYKKGKPWPSGTRFNDASDTGPWSFEEDALYRIVTELDSIAKQYDVTAAQVALRYLLNKQGVCSLIFGVRTVDQLEDNLRTMDFTLSCEDFERLDTVSRPSRQYPYYVYDPVRDE
jgi:aryl-alcohol dehydrogenase-like predicted oxidoreductase